jgi:hypothetical protein
VPVYVASVLSIFLAGVVSDRIWIHIVVLFAMFLISSLILRYPLGLPWSRILIFREPPAPPPPTQG